MNIENLPDYPALQQLTRAIWRQGTARGAAVLIGAGFSKNADRSAADTPEAPLWTDFARSMADQLYPNEPGNIRTDPLRLAEEYNAYFGRAALNELIRTRIVDGSWEPSELHHKLLKLHWSDVLTTNWDTLLERGAQNITERAYEIVRVEADLAHTRSPRIIKLHGSLGATEHFILTEEDYRTYPTKFAAFVNLARQIFVENELCLIGFSGDDPNFLQWAGWVRDNIGGGARRIYLAGVLDMPPAKRKLLESRNIAPIDLGPLFDRRVINRHQAATRCLLDFFADGRPEPLHDWKPITDYDFLPKTLEDQQRLRDPAQAASILDQAAKVWLQDRQSYPGWLICPSIKRQQIAWGSNNCRVTQAILETFTPARRAEILYEIVWRESVSLSAGDEELPKLLSDVVIESEKTFLTKDQRLEIICFLLSSARRNGDEPAFTRWMQLLAAEADPGTDFHAELAYQRVLSARDRLDYAAMKIEIDAVIGQDPIWSLRRAALLFEAGESEAAARIVYDLRSDLERRQRRDPNSLWIRSRRGWAEWMARATRLNQDFTFGGAPWSLEFKAANCDPGDEVDQITNQAAAEVRKRREDQFSRIPPFQAGHYREKPRNEQGYNLSSRELMTTLDLLMERVGLPMSLNHVNLVGSAARDSADLRFDGTVRWYTWLLRSLSGPWGSHFEHYFSRVQVALLRIDVANILFQRVKDAIVYWQNEIDSKPNSRQVGYNHLRILLEVMARLTVRQSLDVGQKNIAFLIEVTKEPWVDHPWLNESWDNLIRSTIEIIPISSRHKIILSLIDFPISRQPFRYSMAWPEPFDYLWKTPMLREGDNSRWKKSINKVIEAAAENSDQRAMAVLRLACLHKAHILEDQEKLDFGRVLWGKIDQSSNLPSGTALLGFIFAELPAPHEIQKADLVGEYLFNIEIGQVLAPPVPLGTKEIENKLGRLQAVASSVQGQVRPTYEQAVKLADSILAWRPPSHETSDPFTGSFTKHLYERTSRLLGDILNFIVIPALRPSDRTNSRAYGLLTFLRELPSWTAAGALPYFLSDDEHLNTEIIQTIQRAILGRTEEEVAGGTAAVLVWANDKACQQNFRLPTHLVERLVSAVETGREIGFLSLLDCLRKLIIAHATSEADNLRMSYFLGELFSEYKYENIDPESRQAVTVSLVRAECVRIANELQACGHRDEILADWLDLAQTDPLPEVRFALSSTSDDES